MGIDGEYRDVVSMTGPAGAAVQTFKGFELFRTGSELTIPATIAIVGAGPAGLIAAEVLATAGHRVTVYDRLASPARKFLMAGRGGLNLTHSEPLETFLSRYQDEAGAVRRAVEAFPPSVLIDWANSLGIETFVGSSGRVFPKAMKASPLLRAWLRRLDALGVALKPRHTWRGFSEDGGIVFETPDGNGFTHQADATILALGGASWPKLGSDGGWASPLRDAGVAITALQPSNCGVIIPWSAYMAKLEGAPLKTIAIACGKTTRRGEAVITRTGLEGGVIYALSRDIREALALGPATITLDLRADLPLKRLRDRIADAATPKATTTSVLRKGAGLSPAACALVREPGPLPRDPDGLAQRIKAVPLQIVALPGLERAISTAGGISQRAINRTFMLAARPGVFAAGEMLDWDAPTGGYLLQACFATGVAAASGVLAQLRQRASEHC